MQKESSLLPGSLLFRSNRFLQPSTCSFSRASSAAGACLTSARPCDAQLPPAPPRRLWLFGSSVSLVRNLLGTSFSQHPTGQISSKFHQCNFCLESRGYALPTRSLSHPWVALFQPCQWWMLLFLESLESSLLILTNSFLLQLLDTVNN